MSVTQKMKHLTKRMVESKHMLKGITVASFLESTIVPIPLEAVMVPLMQARRERLWWIALMATIGCILGAVVGYGLGYFLFDWIGDWVIQAFSSQEQFEQVTSKMESQGFWFVLTLGVAPIPFQIAMLAAGATKFSLVSFLVATAIARSLRYFGLAAVVYFAGNQAESLIKRHKTKAILGVTLVVVMMWWLSTLI
ncbi:YqaA family protein [Marinomonas ostreistagni]|uniref:YqaA family protein n=1 Tax=Marinomonas ostreistagni TaxID=359209 RepID=UPI0019509E6B|nr:VTT domain-containing protein [Marinomonas ostreistagni]MBM6550164.1 DedA family protein [Marinomonas ostreistagni]